MYKFRLLIKVLWENQPYLRLKLLGQKQFYIYHLNFFFLATIPPNKFIQDFSTRLGFVV
jgi:hypothetical protein